MTPINSRQKGCSGEREFAHFLRQNGYSSARRGRQYSGSPDSPDVVCHELSHLHFEVKRTERVNIYKALEQAIEDVGYNQFPVVAHRQSRKEWIVALRAEDFLKLIERETHNGGSKDTEDVEG